MPPGGPLTLPSGLVELGRILGLLLRSRRVRCVGHRWRSRLDLRFHRRLLATLGGGRRIVRARAFHVVLTASPVAGRTAAAATTATSSLATPPALRAHRAEPFAVALPIAAALA